MAHFSQVLLYFEKHDLLQSLFKCGSSGT